LQFLTDKTRPYFKEVADGGKDQFKIGRRRLKVETSSFQIKQKMFQIQFWTKLQLFERLNFGKNFVALILLCNIQKDKYAEFANCENCAMERKLYISLLICNALFVDLYIKHTYKNLFKRKYTLIMIFIMLFPKMSENFMNIDQDCDLLIFEATIC